MLADRLVIIEDGRVVQQGDAATITAQPRTDYVARLVGLNLYRGQATGHTVTLDNAFALTVADPAEGDVFVAFAPTAVALHTRQPDGSPRNTWPATVTGIQRHGDNLRIQLTGPDHPRRRHHTRRRHPPPASPRKTGVGRHEGHRNPRLSRLSRPPSHSSSKATPHGCDHHCEGVVLRTRHAAAAASEMPSQPPAPMMEPCHHRMQPPPHRWIGADGYACVAAGARSHGWGDAGAASIPLAMSMGQRSRSAGAPTSPPGVCDIRYAGGQRVVRGGSRGVADAQPAERALASRSPVRGRLTDATLGPVTQMVTAPHDHH